MLLSNLILLNPSFSNLTNTEKWDYLQKAYYIIVNDISFDPGIYPCLMTTSTVNVDKFVNKAVRVNGSEIAFKEIKNIIRCTFESDESIDANANKLVIGDIGKEFYGFTEAQYDACNAEHLTMPILFNSKQYLECGNFDDLTYPMFIMTGYQYPYPVLHNDLESDATEYRYTISWMVTEYGIEDLYVDDVLGILMLLKACQLMNEDNLNLNNATHYDYICTSFVNLLNTNKESIRNNRTTTLGLMSWV